MYPTERIINNSKAISHRGYGNPFKDNTIAGFKAAVDAGFQWCELDLRITQDGIIVIHHDEDINGVPIAKLPYHSAEALLEDHGILMPTLGLFCRTFKNRIKVNFEFKESGFEQEALDFILKSFTYEDILLTSFDPEVSRNVKELDSKVKTGIIIGEKSFEMRPELSNRLWNDLDFVRSFGADVFVVETRLLDEENIARIAASGLELYVYTVENLEEYDRFMKDDRLKGVITDIVVPD